MSEIEDCIFLGGGIKLIGDTLYIRDIKYPNVPIELQAIIRNTSPYIKIQPKNNLVIIDRWEYKDNKWQKTFKGLVNKIF